MHYLGHVVGKEYIKVDPRIIETITKRHRPLENGLLRSFLGLSKYLSKFIDGYFTLTAHFTYLTSLIRSKTKFTWTKDCERALENVDFF